MVNVTTNSILAICLYLCVCVCVCVSVFVCIYLHYGYIAVYILFDGRESSAGHTEWVKMRNTQTVQVASRRASLCREDGGISYCAYARVYVCMRYGTSGYGTVGEKRDEKRNFSAALDATVMPKRKFMKALTQRVFTFLVLLLLL